MIEHTPGPWRVEEGTTLIWGDCDQDDQTNRGMGYPIAECRLAPSASWAKGPRTYEEAQANARLIAAAPELLDALKSAYDLIDEVIGGDDPDMAIAKLTDVIGDAIAKAEGRNA